MLVHRYEVGANGNDLVLDMLFLNIVKNFVVLLDNFNFLSVASLFRMIWPKQNKNAWTTNFNIIIAQVENVSKPWWCISWMWSLPLEVQTRALAVPSNG